MGCLNSRFIIPALVALLVSGSAWAAKKDVDFSSGNYWYKKCSSDDLADKFYCIGYLRGLSEGLQFFEGSHMKIDGAYRKVAPFCVPKGAVLAQRLDIFKKYLQDHPEKRHKRASILYALAIRKAFCRK
jgi:hypothetical protein